jgi:hypothetical protein
MRAFVIRIRYYLILLFGSVAIITIGSCKKFLDVSPKDVTKDEDFLQNYYDAEYMLRGTYQGLQNIVEPWFVLGELQGDWSIPASGANADMLEIAEHRITPANSYTQWKPYYDLINRANYAIKNLPRVPRNPNYFSETTMRQYIGEVKWLRALAYFHLVRNFGDVPFTLEPTDELAKVKYLPATSQEVILDTIENDLKYSFINCDRSIFVLNTFDVGLRESVETTLRRVTKGTVCALQLEVLLWRNKYQDARVVNQNFINTNSYTSPLNATTGWMDIFTVKITYGEPMLQTNFTFVSREFNPLMKITSNDPASGGKYMVAPSTVAIKTYNPKYPVITTDVTKDEVYRGFGSSYVGSAPFYNRLGSSPVIWKHIALGRVAANTIDVPPNVRLPYESEAVWHTYRIADMLLLRAEMFNRLGEKAQAISLLNSVRSRAGVPNVDAATNPDIITAGSSTEQIENVILKERGLELGFEGRRWYDLMRIARHQGKPDVLVNAVIKNAPAARQDYLKTRLANSEYWYMPYNADEVALNPNLKQKKY